MPKKEEMTESPAKSGESHPSFSSVYRLDVQQQPQAASRHGPRNGHSAPLGTYEFIDSRELASRWGVPVSWVREQVRSRARDPLPHVNLGKYVRFLWGSPELEDWIGRRIVMGNNRRVGRVQ